MSYIRQLLIRQALRHKTNRPSGLIGQYKPYLNSNDSPTRDILKDYSGQGHDIQLYNFGYALQSGYGKYAYDFTKFVVEANTLVVNKRSDKLEITSIPKVGSIYLNGQTSTNKFRIKVIGLTDKQTINVIAERTILQSIKLDGIYDIEKYDGDGSEFALAFRSSNIQETCNITIEQIPDYPGALVSDGVDDYGLCENFPILTKEKGYTVCAIREPIKNDKTCALLAHGVNATSAKSVFIFEAFTTSGDLITSWGNANYTEITDNKFSFLKSDSYNNKLISKGNLTQSVDNRIALFSYTANGFSYLQKAALYALEIYDYDLTDEEIQSVKEAMISEYEEETGNVLEGV